MLRRSARLVIATFVAALVAVGCSGTDAVDKQGYIKENNKIQEEVQKSLAGLSGTSTAEIDKGIVAVDKALADFEELEVPEDYQADHDKMVASVEELRDVMKGLKTAIEKQDPEAAAKLAERASAAQTDFNEAITAMNADLA